VGNRHPVLLIVSIDSVLTLLSLEAVIACPQQRIKRGTYLIIFVIFEIKLKHQTVGLKLPDFGAVLF